MLASCVKHRYNRMIEFKGGTLGFLLWFEGISRDDFAREFEI